MSLLSYIGSPLSSSPLSQPPQSPQPLRRTGAKALAPASTPTSRKPSRSSAIKATTPKLQSSPAKTLPKTANATATHGCISAIRAGDGMSMFRGISASNNSTTCVFLGTTVARMRGTMVGGQMVLGVRSGLSIIRHERDWREGAALGDRRAVQSVYEVMKYLPS
nr:hypothetical protein B0A51_04091 [Rachicladosporium sp. CCFEE 5018]